MKLVKTALLSLTLLASAPALAMDSEKNDLSKKNPLSLQNTNGSDHQHSKALEQLFARPNRSNPENDMRTALGALIFLCWLSPYLTNQAPETLDQISAQLPSPQNPNATPSQAIFVVQQRQLITLSNGSQVLRTVRQVFTVNSGENPTNRDSN